MTALRSPLPGPPAGRPAAMSWEGGFHALLGCPGNDFAFFGRCRKGLLELIACQYLLVQFVQCHRMPLSCLLRLQLQRDTQDGPRRLKFFVMHQNWMLRWGGAGLRLGWGFPLLRVRAWLPRGIYDASTASARLAVSML